MFSQLHLYRILYVSISAWLYNLMLKNLKYHPFPRQIHAKFTGASMLKLGYFLLLLA